MTASPRVIMRDLIGGGGNKNSPKNSPKRTPTSTLHQLFFKDPPVNSPARNSSPRLSRKSDQNEHILSLISHCSVTFTFTDPLESPSQQDFKRYDLIQLLSFVKSTKHSLPDQIMQPLLSMISVNLFRPLPVSCSVKQVGFQDEEDPCFNFIPSWPHIQLVYDILLRLVHNTDSKFLGKYIDQQFLTRLLSLFQSEDSRERHSLKNVYHKLYTKLSIHRSFMRKSMTNAFLHYIFETERHCGIEELLEIWGSIINGFMVPLKEEHKLFLMRVLIPLHKTKGMPVYHRQLAYCVNQFVQKEPMLGGVIMRGLLKYWPITNCQKEVLLIGELEELVESVDPDQYRMLAIPLCTQITRCFNSWNSQVAERALYVWNNERFVKMASSALDEVFPIVVQGMEKNLKWHWSKNVKQLTENVKEMLEDIDQPLYEKCVHEMAVKEYWIRQEQKKRRKKWEKIESQAAKNHQFHKPQQYIRVSH